MGFVEGFKSAFVMLGGQLNGIDWHFVGFAFGVTLMMSVIVLTVALIFHIHTL